MQIFYFFPAPQISQFPSCLASHRRNHVPIRDCRLLGRNLPGPRSHFCRLPEVGFRWDSGDSTGNLETLFPGKWRDTLTRNTAVKRRDSLMKKARRLNKTRKPWFWRGTASGWAYQWLVIRKKLRSKFSIFFQKKFFSN